MTCEYSLEKNLRCNGLEVSDEIKVTIAGQACFSRLV